MKTGRNDPCPCGSGRKFKRCCGSVAAVPAVFDVESLIGMLNSGHLVEAERLSSQQLDSRPDDGFLWKILGVSQMRQQKEALPALRRAAELLPQDTESRSNLVDELINSGNRLRAQGKRSEALATLQEAVTRSPTRPDAHFSLGRVQLESRRIQQAADSFRNAVSRQPTHVAAHLGLATVYRVQGLAAEAEASCTRALALAPQNTDALILMGELRADRGQFTEAHELFERALTTNPASASAYCSIASHKRMTRSDERWLHGAQSLLAGSLALSDEVQLRYALGKYFDEVGDYDSAFSSYARANELNKRFGGVYDEAHFAALIDRIIGTRFDSGLVASDSEVPVFIIGMPRSGTSLAEQILASHPSVSGAGEVAFWDRAFDSPPRASLAAEYLQRLHERAGSAARITDKMPANFLYAGLIHAVFPRARIIHMQRHPIDTGLSIYFQNFFNVSPYANDLKHLAHYYGQYLRIMDHWRECLPLLEVPYERLVADPEEWTRQMLDFIGLPWDPQCLQFHENPRAVITASRWQVRQKINAQSVGRWRNYEKYLEPLRALTDARALPL
jgi:tetratricopeptide (TPR) repeat protein